MPISEKSLLEQMQLHRCEISRRKELLDFNESDCAALVRVREAILPEIDAIVDEFYEKQTSIDEIALIIGDQETLRRLRIAQKQYIDDLFSGSYDEDYVNSRLRIGLVHKRIGIEPKYYVSAVKSLKDGLRRAIKKQIQDRPLAAAVMEALDKLIYLDTELVFETYIRSMLSELAGAKDKAEVYASTLEQRVAQRTEELAQLSRIDSLTGLLNRRAFIDDFRKELARAKRNATCLAVLYLDIDGFKRVNDTEGHSKGDAILQRFGAALKECSRETDIAARIGGDEFSIVLPGTESSGVDAFSQRVAEKLASSGLTLTLSVGFVGTGPTEFEDADTLLDLADRKMYEAKIRSHMKSSSPA